MRSGQLANLLQFVIVIQLAHQLVMQLLADLLRCALQENKFRRPKTVCWVQNQTTFRLTKASGPSSILELVQGFQLT